MHSVFARKIYRFSAVIFPIIYYFTDRFTILVVLSLFLISLLAIEFLRFKSPKLNERIFKLARIFLKEKEKRKISATTVVIFSMLISVILFRKSIAIHAILFLIFSDGIATIIGTKFGRIKIFGEKTVEGSLSFLITCLFIGLIFSLNYGISLPFRKMLIGSIVATFVELLPFDDNLTISLASGIAMSLTP